MQIVCAECGRTIESEFIFCPWCGIKRRAGGTAMAGTNLEGGGALLHKAAQYKKITHMARALDALEKDLSALAMSEDIHT